MIPAFAALPPPALWWIDAAVASLLALALVFGAFSGLSGEAARLVAFAVAFVVAMLVHPVLCTSVLPGDGAAERILAIAAALVAGAGAGFALFRLLRRSFRAAISQPSDSLLGAIFRAATTCVVLLAVFAVLRAIPSADLQDAVFGRTVSGRLAASVLESVELRPVPLDPATLARAVPAAEPAPAAAKPEGPPAAAPGEGAAP